MILVEDKAKELLLSSSATDNTPIYSIGTYKKDDVVQYEGYIYISIADENNELPTNGEKWYNWDNVLNRPFPVKFPINKYRCFDDYSKETSTSGNNLSMTFKNNICTFLGLYNIVGSSVIVTMYDEDETTILYKEERNTIKNPVWNYIDYFYWSDRGSVLNMEFTLPRYIVGITKVEILGEDASVGTVEYAQLRELGCSLTKDTTYNYIGEQKASLDTSTGITYFKSTVKGGTSNIETKIIVPNIDALNFFTEVLYSYRGKTLTFLADDREKEIVPISVFRIRGQVTNFSTSLRGQNNIYSLSIESI